MEEQNRITVSLLLSTIKPQMSLLSTSTYYQSSGT